MASADPQSPSFQQHLPILLGVVLLIVVVIPAWLYSITPEDPPKEGDHVFLAGKQVVYFVTGHPPRGYDRSCVLEPGAELEILEAGEVPMFRATVVFSLGRVERPFCPPGVPVAVHRHQVIKKQPILGRPRETLSTWLRRAL